MFINEREIREKCRDFFPDPDTYDDRCVKEACYDLRIGDEVFLSEQSIPVHLSDDNPYVMLRPGQFALVKTYEEVSVPRDYVAFISIRSTYKFQGLVNISGFHVDPTYRGHLIYSVQNVGPNEIRLVYKEPTFMIMWARLQSRYEGPARRRGYDRIPTELIAQVGRSVTLISLERRIAELSLSLKIYGGFAIAAFLTVLGLLLSRMFGR